VGGADRGTVEECGSNIEGCHFGNAGPAYTYF
jgi:hypothetical protein